MSLYVFEKGYKFMQISSIVTVLTLLSGVALFLYGMSLMGDGLKQMAGSQMEKILSKLTSNPIKGLLLGAIVTAIIQSSSATSVMCVGFVNSGMMKVASAISIIMGANIGTSITGWIICLSYIDGSSGIAQLLSTTTISSVVAIIGIVFKMFAKKDVLKHLGNIMLGFAILMFGMQTMSGAVAPLRTNEMFISALSSFTNPVLGILFGALLAAVLQSASASVGVLQALSVTGAITFSSAFPMLMGIGIGASVPVLLCSIGSSRDGKRTALVYLINETSAMILGSVLFYGSNAIIHYGFLDHVMSPVNIAATNTIYKVLAMSILLPWFKAIEKLTAIIIPKNTDDEDEEHEDLDVLEERFLNMPAVAMAQCTTTVHTMAVIVLKNLNRAYDLFENYDEKRFNKIKDKEARVDKYEDKLGTYLMELTKKELDAHQSIQVSEYLHTIGDFERIGDHAYAIAQVARDLNQKNVHFSDTAQKELKILLDATTEIMDTTVDAFTKNDLKQAARIEPLRELIGMLCDELKMRHIARLRTGECSLEQGVQFAELLNNLERVADHCSNIGLCMQELEENSAVDTHEFEQALRSDKSDEYARYFDEYDVKYEI
jgi:phosphate:Na+ symporter